MGDLYDRRVLNDPEVRLAFGDPLIPIVAPSEVTLDLENADGYFDNLDVRGELLTFGRFDRFSNEQLAELTGRVVGQDLLCESSGGVYARLRVMTHDLAELQTQLPKLTVTAATFPLADPQQGLGKPIPIVFGNAASTNKVTDAWELPYVGENIGSNQYDYLVGHGTFANVTAYRNTVGDTLFTIPGGEYSVNTSAYPGYTVLRFALRQASFGGGMHRIFAAADCSSTTRNFITAIKLILNDSTFGLNLPVNATSFTAGAAVMDSIGSMYCDGVIEQQSQTIDVLSQLLMVRGIMLDKNSAGEWTVEVDTQATTLQGRFGHGQGQQWTNVTNFGGLLRTPVSQAVKSLIVEYRKDRWLDRYVLATTARSVLAVGTEKRIQHDFIRNTTTGDKLACYLANRHIYEDQRLPSFTAGQEARKLRPGQLIGYTSMRPAFDRIFRVVDIKRGLATTGVEARGWDPAIYTYSALTLPGEPAAVTQTDYTRQTPSAPTSVSIASSGTEADGQGGFSAFVVLQYTVAAETWAQTIVRYRRNGTTNWQVAAVDQSTGAALQTKITGLITGLSYDYQISRVNTVDAALSASTTLTNQTAPADTVAPGAPTGLAIIDQHLKSITVAWTPAADKDHKNFHWEARTAASGGGSLVAEGDTEGPGMKVTLVLQQIAYNTTRYLRVRGHDFSGNTGAYSASLSFSFTQVATSDVGNSVIGTSQMIAQAVTTAIRQLVNQQTNYGVSVGAASGGLPTSGGTTFTVGQINIVTVSHTGFSGNTVWVGNNGNSGASVGVNMLNLAASSDSGDVTIHYW